MNVYPLTVYYESACALCNAEMTNLMHRNGEGKLRFVDISAPGFDEFPDGTRMQDLLALVHGRTAEGRVIRGVEVFRLAYAAVGLNWVSDLIRTPWLRPWFERGYGWLARNRHRIPKAVVHLALETGLRHAAQRAARDARCSPANCKVH